MSDELEPGGELIQLRPRVAPPDQGLTVVYSKHPRCAHAAVDLDDNARKAECRYCKAPLDPFDVLVEFGRKWDRFRNDKQRCENEIKGAESRIEMLERSEKNARSRARRMFDDLPSKDEMQEMLDGRLYMWMSYKKDRIELGINRKSLTPHQAREVDRSLLKLARECEKPHVMDPGTGEYK